MRRPLPLAVTLPCLHGSYLEVGFYLVTCRLSELALLKHNWREPEGPQNGLKHGGTHREEPTAAPLPVCASFLTGRRTSELSCLLFS